MSRGFDYAGRLARQRAKEREEQRQAPPRLNPDFPYRATPFPVGVFPVVRVGERTES